MASTLNSYPREARHLFAAFLPYEHELVQVHANVCKTDENPPGVTVPVDSDPTPSVDEVLAALPDEPGERVRCYLNNPRVHALIEYRLVSILSSIRLCAPYVDGVWCEEVLWKTAQWAHEVGLRHAFDVLLLDALVFGKAYVVCENNTRVIPIPPDKISVDGQGKHHLITPSGGVVLLEDFTEGRLYTLSYKPTLRDFRIEVTRLFEQVLRGATTEKIIARVGFAEGPMAKSEVSFELINFFVGDDLCTGEVPSSAIAWRPLHSMAMLSADSSTTMQGVFTSG